MAEIGCRHRLCGLIVCRDRDGVLIGTARHAARVLCRVVFRVDPCLAGVEFAVTVGVARGRSCDRAGLIVRHLDVGERARSGIRHLVGPRHLIADLDRRPRGVLGSLAVGLFDDGDLARSPDQPGIPLELLLPCLEGDLCGPAGRRVGVAVFRVVAGIFPGERVILRKTELDDVIPCREVIEEVLAVSIGLYLPRFSGGIVDRFAGSIQEFNRDVFQARLVPILEAVSVLVLPDEVADLPGPRCRSPDQPGIPLELLLPCLEGDLCGPAGRRVGVAVFRVVAGIFPGERVVFREAELDVILAGLQTAEEVRAPGIGFCLLYHGFAVGSEQFHTDALDAVLTLILYAVLVRIVPDEIADTAGLRFLGYRRLRRGRRTLPGTDIRRFRRLRWRFYHRLRLRGQFYDPGIGIGRATLLCAVEGPGKDVLGRCRLDDRRRPVARVPAPDRQVALDGPLAVELHDPGVVIERRLSGPAGKEVSAVASGDDRFGRLVLIRVPVGPVPGDLPVRSHPDDQGIVVCPSGSSPAHVTPCKDKTSVRRKDDRPGSIVLRAAEGHVPGLVPGRVDLLDERIGRKRSKRLRTPRNTDITGRCRDDRVRRIVQPRFSEGTAPLLRPGTVELDHQRIGVRLSPECRFSGNDVTPVRRLGDRVCRGVVLRPAERLVPYDIARRAELHDQNIGIFPVFPHYVGERPHEEVVPVRCVDHRSGRIHTAITVSPVPSFVARTGEIDHPGVCFSGAERFGLAGKDVSPISRNLDDRVC